MAIVSVHELLDHAAVGGVGFSASKVNTRRSTQLLLLGSDGAAVENTGLNKLGVDSLGGYNDSMRQSSQIKSVVQERLAAKQKRGRR